MLALGDILIVRRTGVVVNEERHVAEEFRLQGIGSGKLRVQGDRLVDER